MQPMELHVHGLQCLEKDFFGEQCVGSQVVGLDGGASLQMSHFLERALHGNHCFGIDEQCAKFGFCGQ